MRKILVKIEDYKRYVSENGSNKLDNYNKIYTNGGFPKFIKVNEEIFNGTKTDYEILVSEPTQYLIKFKSKSGVEYRLDILKEPNNVNEIWHIAFSLFSSKFDNNYHNLTDKKEPIEVFSKLIWILKDLNIDGEFCIGATGDESKDNIYEYMMRFVSGWEKRNTKEYDLGWALYFKL